MEIDLVEVLFDFRKICLFKLKTQISRFFDLVTRFERIWVTELGVKGQEKNIGGLEKGSLDIDLIVILEKFEMIFLSL